MTKKQSQEQFLNMQLQINELQKQVHELKDSQKIKMPSTYLPMKEITKPAMIDSATQMSNPSSPNRPRRPATQHGFEEPHSILRNESAHISSLMEASFNRENSCVPFGAKKFVNSGRRPEVLQQPLFEEQGEEASEESSEEEEEEVQCVDLEPVANIDELFDDFKENICLSRNEECPQVQQFREMGISFVAKEDLYPQPRIEKKAEIDPLLPKVIWNPLQNCHSGTSNSEYSQMINEKAIQYLNRPKLTPVEKDSTQKNDKFSSDPANFSRYGLPDNNISVATKEFLSKNRLTN